MPKPKPALIIPAPEDVPSDLSAFKVKEFKRGLSDEEWERERAEIAQQQQEFNAISQGKTTASSRLGDANAANAAQELTDAVGNLDLVRLAGPQMLVAIYKRSETTKGKIILTHQFLQEDEWQGKVCLVLKKGPAAFVDDETHKFHGFKADVGEWVVLKSAYGLSHHYNGVPCKIIEDAQVLEVIPAPDLVY